MEEIKCKLEYGRPSVVGSALSRLFDNIVAKLIQKSSDTSNHGDESKKDVNLTTKPALKNKKDLEVASEELDCLWTACRSENASTAVSAVDFLIHLNFLGHLDIPSTLSNIMATSSQFKSSEALVHAIGRLLTIGYRIEKDIECKVQSTLNCENELAKHSPEPVIKRKSFGIESNQHPFVSLLRSSPATIWPHISNIIRYFIESDKYIEAEINTFIKPVFLFVLCNPYENANLASLRNEFRRLLIKHHKPLDNIIQLVLEWTKYEDNPATFVEYSQFCLDIFEAKSSKVNNDPGGEMERIVSDVNQLPLMLSLCCHAIKLGNSIWSLLQEIRTRIDALGKLSEKQEIVSEHHGNELKVISRLIDPLNISLIGFSKLLEVAPHMYLKTICASTLSIIKFKVVKEKKIFSVGRWQVGMLVSSLLQMMSFSSSITSKKLIKGGGPKILLAYRSSLKNVTDDSEESTSNIKVEGEWDDNVRWSTYVNRLLTKIQKDDQKGHELALAWVKQISGYESSKSVQKLFPVFSAIVLSTNFEEDKNNSKMLLINMVLEQMVRVVKLQPMVFAPQMLTLILYKLSNLSQKPYLHIYPMDTIGETTHNNVMLQLLSCLPYLALDRGCIGSVLQLIQSLSAKPKLVSLQLELLLQMWKTESRIYPCLQKALEKPDMNNISPSVCGEIAVAKSKVIAEICKSKPHQYGADLLRLLSDILNQCCSQITEIIDVGIQSTFVAAANVALDGILTLCQEGVIDIATTVKVLSPKLKNNPRPEISAKFIELLAISPSFKLDTPEYECFVKDSLEYLWSIACKPREKTALSKSIAPSISDTNSISSHRYVRLNAISAIARFDLEYHDLKMMPGYAKERLKLPPAYCATPSDASRKPEDVLNYVPGEAWTELLGRCETKEELKDLEYLVCAVASQELKSLPRSVFSLSTTWAQKHQKEEPTSYNYLPEKSVLRAIISHLHGLQMNIKPISQISTAGDAENYWTLPTKVVNESFLRILGAQDFRPLPPFEWSTFKPLLESTKINMNCLSIFPILINQAPTSNSARKVIGSILSSGSAVREVVDDVFNNLLKLMIPFLSTKNSTTNSSTTCEVFVRDSVQMWTGSVLRDASATKTYLNILDGCQKALQSTDLSYMTNLFGNESEIEDTVLDQAKDIVCSSLETIREQLLDAIQNPNMCGKDVDLEVIYEKYLDTLAEMPSEKLDKVCR